MTEQNSHAAINSQNKICLNTNKQLLLLEGQYVFVKEKCRYVWNVTFSIEIIQHNVVSIGLNKVSRSFGKC